MLIDPDAARALLQAVLGGDPAAREELGARWTEITSLVLSDASASAALRDLRMPLLAFDDGEAEESDAAEGAYWIGMCLAVPHQEPFVAIEPETARGIAGRMSGIGDNFQLHVLLMEAFPGGERRGLFGRSRPRVSEKAAAIARGKGPQAADEHVTGAWNPYIYAAYRDGRLPDAGDWDSRHLWIWNEGTIADIPQVDGHRVILLGPPSYSRGWMAQRLFDVRATLDARELSGSEVSDWLRRIEAAAAHADVPRMD